MYLLKNDLSVFGCAGSLLLRRLSSSCRQWGLLSSCGAWALMQWLPPVAEHGLSGALASVVVARVLSCSAACGIFPDQELNLRLLHWQRDSSPLNHKEVPHISFWITVFSRYMFRNGILDHTVVLFLVF